VAGIPIQTGRLEGRRQAGFWGHVLVSASACLLTVSIFGSAAFLIYRVYDKQQTRAKVRDSIASLENRTPEELAEHVARLRERTKLAEIVLPELATALGQNRSEQQVCAAIALSRAFVDHRRIEGALFKLRRDPRESIASAAVSALAELQPKEKAAAALGQCLEGADAGEVGPAVIDEACSGLIRLGDAGLAEMQKHLGKLTPDRRVWIVDYLLSSGSPHRAKWLEMLGKDADPKVQTAAREASIHGARPKGLATPPRGAIGAANDSKNSRPS
jgi:hypothetical protein